MTDRRSTPGPDDLWRLAMEHSPVGMAIGTTTGELLAVNPALCDMLGHSAEVLESMHARDITHPDDAEIDRRLAVDALAGKLDSFRVPKRYVRADGSVVAVELTLVLVRGEDGAPLYFVSQVVDRSERQAFEARLEAAEQEVEAERRKSQALFGTTRGGLVLLGTDGSFQAHTSDHQKFLDAAFPDGHLGRARQNGHVYDAEQARVLERHELPSARASAGEEFDDLVVWVGEQPAGRRALSVSARSVRDRSGALTGAALAYQDVTDLIRATRAKDELMASVSHELRTPLSSTLAYLELLEESAEVSDQARTQISAARRNALRVSLMVADLLLAARASAGSLRVTPHRVDLSTLVAEALDSAQVHATAGGVDLEAELPASLPTVVDGLRLRQVVDNLLVNAITYTPAGGRVRVGLVAGADDVVLWVADTGEGIDEADLPEVFTHFFRGDNARRGRVPGAGLGLSIVRAIVEAHGGEVSLGSTAGAGTTVSVTLPR